MANEQTNVQVKSNGTLKAVVVSNGQTNVQVKSTGLLAAIVVK